MVLLGLGMLLDDLIDELTDIGFQEDLAALPAD
jgi:hypothetical protein